jgi:hypothetical protein
VIGPWQLNDARARHSGQQALLVEAFEAATMVYIRR